LSTEPRQDTTSPGELEAAENGAEPRSTAGDDRLRAIGSTELAQAGPAARSLAVFGLCAGWGLAVLGLLESIVRAADAVTAVDVTPARRVTLLLHAGGAFLGCVLLGWGTYLVSRLTATAWMAYLNRFFHASDDLVAQAARAVALLETVAKALEERSESGGSLSMLRRSQAQSVAEFERATRTGQWAEAEGLLEDFAVNSWGEPRLLAGLREELDAARRGAIEEGLARLEAARSANDADRVLEVFQVLSSSLGDEARGSLSRELAAWFLSLIHRRLRAGKIQADVVQLAGRFADTFATTVEGASVRASLSTLRRSVGLCPRCAQPYTGIAEACSVCLGGAIAPASGMTHAQSAGKT
jgi:hypothetical protein